MADKKQDDNEGLDIWDIAIPVGGAILAGGAARRLGRRMLPFKGKYVDRARAEGMSERDLQKYPGSVMRRATEEDVLERIPPPRRGDSPEKLTKNIDELARAQREAEGYGRIGKARATLTVGGAAIGYKTGADANAHRRRRK